MACWAVAAVVILALATTLVVLLSTEGSSGSDETDRVRFTQYAATMITELTTLNRDNVDRVTAQLKAAGAGTALGADDESLDQIVELVKTQNVTTTGKVVRTAVSKLSDSSATILLVSGWRMESPVRSRRSSRSGGACASTSARARWRSARSTGWCDGRRPRIRFGTEAAKPSAREVRVVQRARPRPSITVRHMAYAAAAVLIIALTVAVVLVASGRRDGGQVADARHDAVAKGRGGGADVHLFTEDGAHQRRQGQADADRQCGKAIRFGTHR